MTTEVIILAQGVQSRLPDLALPKQWLPLPACAEAPILYRTLVQLSALIGLDVNEPHIVTWPALRHLVVAHHRMALGAMGLTILHPHFVELEDPGNSSLKGAKGALAKRRTDWVGNPRLPSDRTVILLGDVVYSWACLEHLLDNTGRDVTVCGTSDLSPSGGELWGLSWHRTLDGTVRGALDVALEKHPPFKDYQPGQLRRWYWQMATSNAAATHVGHTIPLVWQTVDDYTDDVDVPADLKNLPLVAAAAAADDLKRGITWPL